MRLSDVAIATLEESRIGFVFCEEGEGPRWKFDYTKASKDPHPDILLLGAYQHPTTGNNLVGGVNLNYLDERERDELAKSLPKIMGGKDLKNRYWIGRKSVPNVFQKYYRTYNARYIRGVNTDVMYPKYGLMKTTQQWLKKKLGGIFKSKAQRQQDLKPKYPTDLDNMQDRLDQVVRDLQQRPEVKAEPVEPEQPEIRAARDDFKRKQKERTEQDIERREDIPLRLAKHDAEQEIADEPPDQQLARKELERQREKTRQELLNPDNEIDLEPELPEPEEPEEEPPALEDTIAYYSPIAGHVIFEPFRTAITHDNKPIFPTLSEGWGSQRTLSGEYWLDNGSSLYAENDMDHTIHVIDVARSFIADELELGFGDEIDDWDGICAELAAQNPELGPDIMSKTGAVRSWAGDRQKLEAFLAQHGISMELWDIANWIGDTDPRLYAAQHWGWVRNQGNNIETYDLSRSKLKEIANGLGDAYFDEELEQQAFDIYVYNTKAFYRDVPFDIIEAGDVAALRDYGQSSTWTARASQRIQ